MLRLRPRLLAAIRYLVAKTSAPPTGIFSGMYVSTIIVRVPGSRRYTRS